MNYKGDATYSFTKRLSAVASVTFDDLLYQKAAEKVNDFYSPGGGIQLRYLLTPHLSLSAEGRLSEQLFGKDPGRNLTTETELIGADWTITKSLSVTERFGLEETSFQTGGLSQTSPYSESSLIYRYSKTGFLSLNGRYGFEAPPNNYSTVQTLRVGANAVQALNKRLRLTAGIDYVDTKTNQMPKGAASSSVTQDSVDFSLGMEYVLNPRFTIHGSYTFIESLNQGGVGDYYRNQIFLGADYTF